MSKVYGGIEDLLKYINNEYGASWVESKASTVSGIENFTQASLEGAANNCTLAAITRIMRYFRDKGYNRIPSDIGEIYKRVRKVAVEHGYDPKKVGFLRDLFVYTPWEIDDMVRDVWKAFGYADGNGNNRYLFKLGSITNNIDNGSPILLNITSGYYENHTVCVIGYKVFSRQGERDMMFVQVYDGWSEAKRYIDWDKFGFTPASVTSFLQPLKK
jgi:hypothetical protein